MSLVVNKHKIYNYEERAYESLGNILSIKTSSYKLYCKLFWKIPRYSYLLSYRCIDFITQEGVTDILRDPILKNFKEKTFLLEFFFDVLTLDDHINSEILTS